MYKTISLLISILLVTSCGIRYKDPFPVTTAITDPNKRIEIERISFLPPAEGPWKSVNYEVAGSVKFEFSSKERGMYVDVNPFPNGQRSYNFDKYLQKSLGWVQASKNSVAKNKVSVIHKAGMRCVMTEIFDEAIKRRDKVITVEYLCEQPNQPKDLPLIDIEFSDSTMLGVKAYNPDEILAPIWNSIKFKPIERETSIAYQNWKKRNGR